MSKQIKVCPGCQTWNDARAIECTICGRDLTNVKLVTKENASSSIKQTQKTASVKGKICTECGYVNPSQARKCEKCKEDLSDVKIVEVERTEKQESEEKRAYEFIEVDGHEHFSIPEGQGNMILGREGFLSEYLSNKQYVSRHQAAIAIDGDRFLIRNLSRTNPTFVDNQELESGKEYAFFLGKEIGLGGKVINGSRQRNAAYLVLKEKK